MNWDQYACVDCMIGHSGVSFGEIKRTLQWGNERLILALLSLDRDGYAKIALNGVTVLFEATQKGVDAHKVFNEIPF